MGGGFPKLLRFTVGSNDLGGAEANDDKAGAFVRVASALPGVTALSVELGKKEGNDLAAALGEHFDTAAVTERNPLIVATDSEWNEDEWDGEYIEIFEDPTRRGGGTVAEYEAALRAFVQRAIDAHIEWVPMAGQQTMLHAASRQAAHGEL